MQSTKSASMMALRISPSPDWFDDIEPLASTKPARRVVDAPLVGREHLDQHADDMRRRVELAAALALRAGEAGKEILIDAAECVLGAVSGAAERDVADQIDDLAEPHLVEAGAGEIF